MPTIAERVGKIFYGRKIRQLESAVEDVMGIYDRMPFSTSPEQMVAALGEVDDRYIDLLVRQIKNRETYLDSANESVRQNVVSECRNLYVWDVITQSIVDLWTDYGFGLRVDVTPTDEGARDDFDEFWHSKRNSYILGDQDIAQLSTNLLNDGEFYFVFFISTIDGATTVRYVPTDEIKEIITTKGDKYENQYYKREYVSVGEASPTTVYYPDWRVEDPDESLVPDTAKIADYVSPDEIKGIVTTKGDKTKKGYTKVVMMQVTFRKRHKHGWPLMTAGAAWSRAYRNFLQDRASVAKAVAMYVDKITVKGGSRAVDNVAAAIRSSLVSNDSSSETNPAPTAGSAWVQNEALDRERRPLTTGAGDAEKDGAPLLAQAGLAGRVFPHYLGRGDSFRLATASAMEVPVKKAFSRYQLLWSAVWRDVANVVLSSLEEYGGKSYATYGVTVHTDNIVEVDLEDLSRMLSSIKELAEFGMFDADEGRVVARKLIQTGMVSLGISEANDLLPDEEINVELGEKAAIDTYRTSLRAPVYGLWSGKIVFGQFEAAMQATVDRNLRRAWAQALEQYNMTMADITSEEQLALGVAVLDEFGHIPGFGDHILANNKASGGLLKNLMPRMEMWVNRYNDIYNRALSMVAGDQQLEWVLGPTKENCRTCLSLSGKVKRGSFWENYFMTTGIRPQSEELACSGYRCLCTLKPTTKGLTRGRLPVRK